MQVERMTRLGMRTEFQQGNTNERYLLENLEKYDQRVCIDLLIDFLMFCEDFVLPRGKATQIFFFNCGRSFRENRIFFSAATINFLISEFSKEKKIPKDVTLEISYQRTLLSG